MDFGKLRTGELVAGISGLLLLFTIFVFDWFGVGGAVGEFASAAGVDTGVNAWTALDFIRFLLLLSALAGIGLAVLGATGRSVALPVAASVIVTVLGLLTALLVLYRIVNQPGPNDVVEVKFGAYLGFLFTAGVAAGGFMAMADEGTSLGDAARRAQGGGPGGPGTGGPGTPAPAAGTTPPAPPAPPQAGPPPASGPPAGGPQPGTEPPPTTPGGPPAQG